MSSRATVASVYTWDHISRILFSSIIHNGTHLDMTEIDLGLPLVYGDILVFVPHDKINKISCIPDSVSGLDENKIAVTTRQHTSLFNVVSELVSAGFFSHGECPVQTTVFPFVILDRRFDPETIRKTLPQLITHFSLGAQ